MSDNPVVHFEMPYDDDARMRAFYEAAFGWRMVPMGPEMGDYVMAQTAETDAEGMVQTQGAINGGFAPRSDQADRTNLVIGVADIDAAMAAVLAAGGEVLGTPMDIPGVGTYVNFVDTEGNRLSLLQPVM